MCLGLGVFSSQISVFPSRGVSFSQIVFFGSRGVSGSQVLVFPVPGLVFFLPVFCIVFWFPLLVFSLPGVLPPGLCVFSVPGLAFSLPSSCVGVFGSQVWVFSVLDNVFPARLLCWCALSRVCLSAFVRISGYHCPPLDLKARTRVTQLNRQRTLQNRQSHSL